MNGLSGRASLPGRVRRGDRLAAVLALRFDPGSAAPATKYLDLRNLEWRVRLLFRNVATGATAEVEPHGDERVLETPQLQEEGGKAPPVDPGWIPVGDFQRRYWTFEFPLAREWDGLATGTWEARVEFALERGGAGPGVWFGTVSTEPVPIVVEEAPPRHLRFRPPTALRLRAGERKHTVDVVFDPGDSAVVDLAPRNGFLLVMEVQAGMVTGRSSGMDLEVADDEAVDLLLPDETGPFDRTYAIEILETTAETTLPFTPRGPRTGYRSLWKKSFRVQATAGEIQALMR